MSWQFNALLSGDAAAKSMGVAVDRLRFVSMLLASVITAVCVSFLGIIGKKAAMSYLLKLKKGEKDEKTAVQ